MKKIIIIGAGPTGLGAAYRLKKFGYDNFIVYERSNYAGGLCASFKDDKGFTWDLGGHILFSKYKYFNIVVENILQNNYVIHKRNAWIRTMDRWIPYPFQKNIRYLPGDIAAECLRGIRRASRENKEAANFQEWIINNMGEGIAKYFMLPYNFKVWAYPLYLLSSDWITDRVSSIKLQEMRTLLMPDVDKNDWGQNATFKYPLYNGIGGMF